MLISYDLLGAGKNVDQVNGEQLVCRPCKGAVSWQKRRVAQINGEQLVVSSLIASSNMSSINSFSFPDEINTQNASRSFLQFFVCLSSCSAQRNQLLPILSTL
ncbi:hypothetical protein Ddc_14384 [Ditylenchus destructor]|nr:hypothetical protein Ddc_14384 [Ditylenchus destructor]